MRFRGLTALAVLAAVAVAMTALASVGTGAVPKKKPVKPAPLCKLGQVTLKGTQCRKNPAFANRACDAYNAQVTAIVGAPAIGGQNRAGGGPSITCYFNVGGKTQRFFFMAYRKVPSHTRDVAADAAYDYSWNEAVDWTAKAGTDEPGCYTQPPGQIGTTTWQMNPPQPLAGLGDKAYTWDQCTPHGDSDFTQMAVLKGTAFYIAAAYHPATSTTLDQLVTFMKQVMKTYP